jgi:hypothetical protein
MVFTHNDRSQRRQLMAQHVARGHTLADTASHFGVTTQTVRSSCLQYDQPTRNEQLRLLATGSYAALADLLNTEHSLSEIARRRRSTRQRVFSVMQQAIKSGIQIKERS